jgi:hypothetical protein
MEQRPTPERPATETTITPPGRAKVRLGSSASRIWISFNTRGDGRAYTTSSGAGIALALVIAVLMAAGFAVVLATFVIWIVLAGVLFALLILAIPFLRRLRIHR